RSAVRHAARMGRHRPGCRMERRFSSFVARAAQRRNRRLLPGFRRGGKAGARLPRRLRLHRAVFPLPRAALRQIIRGAPRPLVRRFLAESRSGRQPPRGDRLAARLPIERLKLAAAAVLLSPFLPLLFMGEEYGEHAPFNYFVSHGDPALVEAVRKGRREEFAAFAWGGEVPDPQDERTFLASKLNWGLRRQGEHAALLNFYAELLRLRRTIPALSQLAKERTEATPFEAQKVLLVRRWAEESQVFAMFHFGEESVSIALPIPAGRWRLLLDSPESHSGLPAELDSPGEIKFSLRPSSFALFLEGKPNTAR